MDVEKIGKVYSYRLTFADFVIIHGLFGFLDEKRRQGGSTDKVPLHSAIRPVYSHEAPSIDKDDEECLVRWIYEYPEEVIGNTRQPVAAPSLDALIALAEEALEAYEDPSQHHLLNMPIGRIVLERPIDKPAVSVTSYHPETLQLLKGNVMQGHAVFTGWNNYLSNE